ncbi:hypothetical protein PAHAL_4G018500 [Panicum hallii]|uniref:Uncharacterized protein n=1 Tax=Panicum hallii TaxID=206008 RepID=A0A2S3HGH6_9POAL|nr:uncharacterized protein LOC112890166 [Panicum hallii]XP_025812828.1 uncharacterized protein LOC112890166 [Panicum hallii]PAN22416.1 hypothetical protein PAHAL_4G018500 [Panicum hallii]PAN22429.2 hypothetical protein PAHAL_4G018500 [Panicum hallii]
MDAGGGVRAQGVNPDCPNAANPFHRCAEYCPVPAPRAAAAKPSPPRPRAAQNGTRHGDGAKRVVPAAADDSEEEAGAERAVNPDCPNASNRFHSCAEYCPVPAPLAAAAKSPPPPGPGHAAQNGTAHRDDEECEITTADDSEGGGETIEESPEVGGARRSARPPAKDEEAAGDGQWQGVNPDCPNAANPFHRCAEYCPVPAPRAAAKHPPPPRGHEGSTHSDPGELHPRPRRRDKGGGSGGLPLYVFLREGSDGDGKKVDPRCPNAPNPFHVCTDHCLAKMAEAGRSSEGGKSPLSIFSRHSRRSSSSSEEGSVKSAGSRKVDPKCPNAVNPFHECGEQCAAKMQQVEQHKGTKMQSPRKKGGKDVALIPNWKVDPRCPNASNPFHMCAQYCFDHLNETAQTSATKSDKKKGKAVSKEVKREINPDCANASNPYHTCGEHCKRKGDR